MGTVFASGIGSGLDIAGLVSQLVAAEGQAKSVRLDTQEATLQAKISAVGSLRASLSAFRDAMSSLQDSESIDGRVLASSTSDFVSATAASSVVPGSYDIEVERLATAHRLSSSPFVSETDVIGTGTLSMSVAGKSFSIVIDATSNTVAGIRDAINTSSANTGISASIITGVDGARLILSAQETGAVNTIVVTQTGGDGGLSAIVYDPANAITNLTESQAAIDARILVNSFAVESASNTVSGAVEGLDIGLLATNTTGEITTLTVSRDQGKSSEAISQFVNGYNALIDSVASATSFNVETRQAGPLLGDALLGGIMFQLRRDMNQPLADVTAPFRTLFDLGISTQLDGKLSFDSAKLNTALAQDFDAVAAFFADDVNGIAARLDARLDPYLTVDGVLDSRGDGLKASVEVIDERREVLNQQLISLEARLSRQFNAMDTLVAQLKSTGNFLTAQLANLPGATFKQSK